MRVATETEVEAYLQPDASWSDSLRGVLVEIATTGVLRYPWKLLCPLFCTQLDHCLRNYVSIDDPSVLARLHAQLQSFLAPPLTVQRLAEVLLEPKKQYSRLEKVTSALERLLSVTTTLSLTDDPPPLPTLDSLADVNANPPSVAMRRMVSSGAFRGFLEGKKTASMNGSTSRDPPNLVTHLIAAQETLSPHSPETKE